MRRSGFSSSFDSCSCGCGGIRFGGSAFRLGCVPDFPVSGRPKPPPERPYKLRGIDAWPSEQSDSLTRRTRAFKKQLGSAVSHHPPHLSAIRWNRNWQGVARNSSAQKNDSQPALNKLGGKSSVSGEPCKALFAFVDSLAKVVLTCVPKPGGEAMEAAVARARGRHARLLKSAGQAMFGDSQEAMQDLVKRGEG
jgi:hypothetical protein